MTEHHLSIAALAGEGPQPARWLPRWARVPRLPVLAVTPLVLFAASWLVLFGLWAVGIPNELEAALMGAVWIGATAASGAFGMRSARGQQRARPWLLALAVTVAISPLAMTPVLGPDAGAGLVVLAGWGAALVVLAVAGDRVAAAGGKRTAAAFAVATGAALVMLAAFLLARLNLPADQVPLRSAPWWLPVAVSDHALAPEVVNRLDATRVGFGGSLLFAYATAFVLAYALRAGPPATQATRSTR